MAATQFCQEQKTDLRNNIFILQNVPAYRIVQYLFVLVTYKYLYRATEVVTVPQEEPDPHSIEMTLSLPHPSDFSPLAVRQPSFSLSWAQVFVPC